MKIRIAAIFLFVLAGCILASSCDVGAVHKEAPPPPPRSVARVMQKEPSEREPDAAGLPDSAGMQRRFILDGNMTLTVKSVVDALQQIRSIQEAEGGYMTNMSTGSESASEYVDGSAQGSITIMVPQHRFEAVMARIRKLGKVEDENISGTDVTDEFMDMRARLRNLQRQETRYLDLLDKSASVSDILKVEEQLNRVRGEIEVLTGRVTQLQNKTDYATLTVSLMVKPPVVKPDRWSFKGTLNNAARAFLLTINLLIRAAIWLGVFLPLFIGFFLLLRWIVRRRRR